MTTLTTYLLYRGKGFSGEGGADTGIELPDDFAGIDAPKSLFMFTMSIVYRKEATALGYENFSELAAMEIPLKSVTRPEPTIEYLDVNYYNYRTKVPVKTDLGTVTVVMYDDSKNKAHHIASSIFNKFYKPIYADPATLEDGLENIVQAVDDMTSTEYGIDTKNTYRGASSGPIKHIDVSHYHYLGSAVNEVVYRYHNPKITTFSMDALDMSSSDASTITMTFNYDILEIFNDEPRNLTDRSGTVTVGDGSITGGRLTQG